MKNHGEGIDRNNLAQSKGDSRGFCDRKASVEESNRLRPATQQLQFRVHPENINAWIFGPVVAAV
jgi:hypothetical protein